MEGKYNECTSIACGGNYPFGEQYNECKSVGYGSNGNDSLWEPQNKKSVSVGCDEVNFGDLIPGIIKSTAGSPEFNHSHCIKYDSLQNLKGVCFEPEKKDFPLTDCQKKDTLDSLQKEEDSMSLVVSLWNEHGLVVASDSKSTITVDGVPCKESGRNAKKLFKGNNYIIGAIDCNRVGKYEVEEIIGPLVKQFPDNYKNVFENFKNYSKAPDTYAFIVIERICQPEYKRSISFAFHGFNVVGNQITESVFFNNMYQCVLSGAQTMCPRIVNCNPNWTLKELKHKAKIIVETVIVLGDELMSYNPVGGDIQLEFLEGNNF